MHSPRPKIPRNFASKSPRHAILLYRKGYAHAVFHWQMPALREKPLTSTNKTCRGTNPSLTFHMLETEVDYLDSEFTVPSKDPTTLAEIMEMTGLSEAEIVASASDNFRYRNKYPRVYAKASAEVATALAKRIKEEKTNKDGSVKKVYISDNDHLREYNGTGDEAHAKLGEIFARLETAEPLWVKGERAPGQGKISQAALDTANNFLSKGDDAVEKVVSHIEAQVAGYKIGRTADGTVTPESLARGIQALQKEMERKAKEAAKQGLLAAVA